VSLPGCCTSGTGWFADGIEPWVPAVDAPAAGTTTIPVGAVAASFEVPIDFSGLPYHSCFHWLAFSSAFYLLLLFPEASLKPWGFA
jgi:hypothetical protein